MVKVKTLKEEFINWQMRLRLSSCLMTNPYIGEVARDDGGIVCVLCNGYLKLVTEFLLIIHLVRQAEKVGTFYSFKTFLLFNSSSLTACLSAYPMFLNPPNQFFENLMGIPLSNELKDIIKI